MRPIHEHGGAGGGAGTGVTSVVGYGTSGRGGASGFGLNEATGRRDIRDANDISLLQAVGAWIQFTLINEARGGQVEGVVLAEDRGIILARRDGTGLHHLSPKEAAEAIVLAGCERCGFTLAQIGFTPVCKDPALVLDGHQLLALRAVRAL